MTAQIPSPPRRFRSAITTTTMLKRWKRSAGVGSPPSLPTTHLSPYPTPLATPSSSRPASWHGRVDTAQIKCGVRGPPTPPPTPPRPILLRSGSERKHATVVWDDGDVWLCRKPSPCTNPCPIKIRTTVVIERCVDDGEVMSMATHREPQDRSPRGSPRGRRQESRDGDYVLV
ncbi:hypothetical protein CspeluHIS016_0505670 [Cutaneotrichosporon spelunceum]|uniref:Uncharacterized protein n=1 Tax=Cutaneotrichosporon spelunceum TaxID=1672016 RepID=A0AAD3YCV6_9TREE|nr:hypothetical protein CspeluHIS016_0505670 [Cutaneotrichosporon spelunceum]